MRRQLHTAAAVERQAIDELPGLQEASAQGDFLVQFPHQAQAHIHFGRQKGRIHSSQESQQGRIRATVVAAGHRVREYVDQSATPTSPF